MTLREQDLLVDEKTLFSEPKTIANTKKEFLNTLKQIIEKGGEISWFTTENRSFEWPEINTNPKKFLKELSTSIDFKIVDIGVFYPKTKKTQYTSYEIQ